ncbi:hypothetical protein HDEF_1938 [Candidatus Hamiltonella defensa 5AT (Acyrthosiphon pisum)]|uniref:EF-hand domain-containing protein n=1 Tax=Hamiltonella defensa subsp. Acyrthosiphon pisum (strain 5AT) TaxID=572265 RepID=C4K7I3_HAMD5|nr:hypothetical protein HDEF_1938 [Candidatus Hamiltonella defensa 5AT (Acyrthosiphon pisum)]
MVNDIFEKSDKNNDEKISRENLIKISRKSFSEYCSD